MLCVGLTLCPEPRGSALLYLPAQTLVLVLSKCLDKIFLFLFFFFCAKLPVLCSRAWSLLQDSVRGNCSATAKLSLSAKLLPCCSFMSAFSLRLVHLEEKKKK